MRGLESRCRWSPGAEVNTLALGPAALPAAPRAGVRRSLGRGVERDVSRADGGRDGVPAPLGEQGVHVDAGGALLVLHGPGGNQNPEPKWLRIMLDLASGYN